MDRLADPIAFSLTLMAATMIEMDDGAQLRTWTAGPVIPQRLPVVMVHGGPGVPDYLAPAAKRNASVKTYRPGTISSPVAEIDMRTNSRKR